MPRPTARAGGRSLNPGGGAVVIWWANLPPFVGIGLTYLPESGRVGWGAIPPALHSILAYIFASTGSLAAAQGSAVVLYVVMQCAR